MSTKFKIIIEEAEDDPVLLLEEILRLVKKGFTSGVNPNWEIIETK